MFIVANSSTAVAAPPSPAQASTIKRPAPTNHTSSPTKLPKPNANILKEELPTEPVVKPDPESQSKLSDQKIRSNISPKEERTIRLANKYKLKLNKATNKSDKEKYFQLLAELYGRRENFADNLLGDMKNGETTGLKMRAQCQFCEKPYQQHRSYVRHLLVDHSVQLSEFCINRIYTISCY